MSQLMRQNKSFNKTLETFMQSKPIDNNVPMPSCLAKPSLPLDQSIPLSLARTETSILLDIKLFPQPLLLFLSEFINRLHLNDWRIAAILPELQRLLGSIPIILEPPYEAMLEPGQTLDVPTMAVLRVTALHISLEESVGRTIGQSSFWSDAEKASLDNLMNYAVTEDAVNYLHMSLLGPFQTHVMGAAMALGLLVEQLASCVKKVNFQRYASTQSGSDSLYAPATACQNVTKIYETVARIVAGRRVGVAESASKAVTMQVLADMLDDTWEQSDLLLSIGPEEQTFVNLIYLPYSKQQALDVDNQVDNSNPEGSKLLADSVDPSFGKYAQYWRRIFDYASGKEQVPPPGTLTSYKQAICPDNDSVECNEFVGAAGAVSIDSFDGDAFFTLINTNLKPLLDSYDKYPEIINTFIDVLRKKDVSWLARMVIGGVKDAKDYWNDSVAALSRTVIAESQGSVTGGGGRRNAPQSPQQSPLPQVSVDQESVPVNAPLPSA